MPRSSTTPPITAWRRGLIPRRRPDFPPIPLASSAPSSCEDGPSDGRQPQRHPWASDLRQHWMTRVPARAGRAVAAAVPTQRRPGRVNRAVNSASTRPALPDAPPAPRTTRRQTTQARPDASDAGEDLARAAAPPPATAADGPGAPARRMPASSAIPVPCDAPPVGRAPEKLVQYILADGGKPAGERRHARRGAHDSRPRLIAAARSQTTPARPTAGRCAPGAPGATSIGFVPCPPPVPMSPPSWPCYREHDHGLTPNTLDLRRAAIRYLHHAAGCASPTDTALEVSETMALAYAAPPPTPRRSAPPPRPCCANCWRRSKTTCPAGASAR